MVALKTTQQEERVFRLRLTPITKLRPAHWPQLRRGNEEALTG